VWSRGKGNKRNAHLTVERKRRYREKREKLRGERKDGSREHSPGLHAPEILIRLYGISRQGDQ
jgi:hypothetical protein